MPVSKTVLVFKTSVETTRQVNVLRPLLDGMMAEHEKWNFDLEDCDRILRIESVFLSVERVIETVKTTGFWCEELE